MYSFRDPYDHPSQSIPSAAYPDTPYRPGTGPDSPPSPTSTGNRAVTGSSDTSSEQEHHDISTIELPRSPPPPYKPSPVPTAYSPLDSNSLRRTSGSRVSGDVIALQVMPPYSSLNYPPSSTYAGNSNQYTRHEGFYSDRQYPLMHRERHPRPPPPHPFMNDPVASETGKLVPVEDTRRHKRQQTKLLLLAGCVFVMLVISLSTGLAIVFHASRQGNNDDGFE